MQPQPEPTLAERFREALLVTSEIPYLGALLLRNFFTSGQNEWSTRSRILDGVLATFAYLYTMFDMFARIESHLKSSDVPEPLLMIPMFWYEFFYTAVGMVAYALSVAGMVTLAHAVGRSNPLLWMKRPGEVDRLSRDRLAESLERDGVNILDFQEIVTTSVAVLGAVPEFLLIRLVSYLFFYPCALLGVVTFSSSFRPGGGFGDAVVWLVLTALALGTTQYLLSRFGLREKLKDLRQYCRSQPSCKLARTVLLLSSVVYAIVVLCFCPAPPVVRWGVITTHTARALKLLASVRDQSGAMGAAADVPRDTFRSLLEV